jgi:hypothetical protein
MSIVLSRECCKLKELAHTQEKYSTTLSSTFSGLVVDVIIIIILCYM